MRLQHPFGVKRQVAAVVENPSGDGAFLRTTETIDSGEQVFVVFRLSATGHTEPHVAARAGRPVGARIEGERRNWSRVQQPSISPPDKPSSSAEVGVEPATYFQRSAVQSA